MYENGAKELKGDDIKVERKVSPVLFFFLPPFILLFITVLLLCPFT